jgi:hypothetical protein
VPDGSAGSLRTFIEEVVEPGSLVHTDGWLSYERLKAARLPGSHHVGDHPGPANDLLPRVHLVASLRKRWVLEPIRGCEPRLSRLLPWTNSRTGSTGAGRATEACCSPASPKRPSRSSPRPIA